MEDESISLLSPVTTYHDLDALWIVTIRGKKRVIVIHFVQRILGILEFHLSLMSYNDNINMSYKGYINNAACLVTTMEQTKAGFIEAALLKGQKAAPYIEEAKCLKTIAKSVKKAKDLLAVDTIRPLMLAAAGLSDKAFKYFTETDKTEAIKALIENYLEPTGENFVDELIYRFLLTRGDTLGGVMRNFAGTIAQIKVVRRFLCLLKTLGLEYVTNLKIEEKHQIWCDLTYEEAYEKAINIKAIYWETTDVQRLLFFNKKIRLVDNNVDICLYNAPKSDYDKISSINEKALMFGELKGGIDPAGADEHWKTGNTALNRIRNAFAAKGYSVLTSFIAASIQQKMAEEIYQQLQTGTLSEAANITVDEQLTKFCEWILTI